MSPRIRGILIDDQVTKNAKGSREPPIRNATDEELTTAHKIAQALRGLLLSHMPARLIKLSWSCSSDNTLSLHWEITFRFGLSAEGVLSDPHQPHATIAMHILSGVISSLWAQRSGEEEDAVWAYDEAIAALEVASRNPPEF